jgi:hypothetical protein
MAVVYQKPTNPRFQDLTGRTFGRLTVTAFAEKRGKKLYWKCRCDCGNETIVVSYALTAGTSSSCGCFRREFRSKESVTHGLRSVPEYNIWAGIKQRCCNPSSELFARYGARGITICDRWRESFEAFYADMGPRPTPQHTIERKNNDGNYEPGNCIWATMKVQERNRRNNRLLTHEGITATIAEWSERTGIAYATIYSRLRKGVPVAVALKRTS